MKQRYNNFTVGWLFAGTVIMMIIMFVTGRPLATPATPQGILCLEFATTATAVEQVLHAWKNTAPETGNVLLAAKLNTYLDFIFLFFYSLLLSALCYRLARILFARPIVSKIFSVLSGIALAAGVLDIVENVGMLFSLNGQVSDATALMTCVSAKLKWGLVFGVIGSIAAGWVYKQWFFKTASYKLTQPLRSNTRKK